jgi:hypothetical protein
MTLTAAIQAADLPGILERHFPTCGARAGKAGRIRCVWRQGEDLSGNLFKGKRKWQLHDFVTGETWDAFDVLTHLVGMSRAEAALELTGVRPISQQNGAAKTPQIAEPVPVDTWVSMELPEMPQELLEWMWAFEQVKEPMFGDPMSPIGQHCLELLAGWVAECIRLEMGESQSV